MSAAGSRVAAAVGARTGGGRNAVGWLATAPRVPWVVAIVFTVTGLIGVHTDAFLNNEGMLSWIFSGLTSEAPLDMLFFLKARPPISVLYAPVAAIGLPAFLSAHVLLAALAIPLTASLARRFGHDSPNLSAVLVALSPLYFAGAAAGVQNTDATLGVLVVAWLLSRQRPVVAGLVLSLVVVSRVETFVFALAFAFYALRHRGYRRLVIAAGVIPLVFWLAGAVYHGDILWPFHYPSSAPDNPVIDAAERATYGGSIADAVTTILALTPVAGVLAWVSLRGCALENTLTLAALAFVAALRVLPFTQLVYVDASPRYVLPALPFVALAVDRAVAGWGRSRWDTAARGAALLGLGVVGLTWVGGLAGALLFAAAVACVVAAALAALSRGGATMLLVLIAAAGVWPLLATTHLYSGDHARQLDEIVDWMTKKVPRGAVVVTDQHVLGVWLPAHAPALDVDVRHVVQPDMLYEMRTLTNPATRQFQTFFGTKRYFYAPWISPADIPSAPGEVVFVMRTDTPHRARALSEPPFDRVEWTVRGDRWIGGRLRQSATREP